MNLTDVKSARTVVGSWIAPKGDPRNAGLVGGSEFTRRRPPHAGRITTASPIPSVRSSTTLDRRSRRPKASKVNEGAEYAAFSARTRSMHLKQITSSICGGNVLTLTNAIHGHHHRAWARQACRLPICLGLRCRLETEARHTRAVPHGPTALHMWSRPDRP